MKKTVLNGYILSFGEIGNVEISDEEYDRIAESMESCPTPPEGYARRLADGTLEWEMIEVITAAEE